SGTWRIRVTNHKCKHNHQLRRAVYENYPANRHVTDPDALGVVDELVKAAAKPKNILKFCKRRQTNIYLGKRVTLQDVHNLVKRSKARRRGEGTVGDRLDTVLWKFCSVRGNNTTIFVDKTKTTQMITIQSRQMTRFFEAFPEVVMLDSTHFMSFEHYGSSLRILHYCTLNAYTLLTTAPECIIFIALHGVACHITSWGMCPVFLKYFATFIQHYNNLKKISTNDPKRRKIRSYLTFKIRT
ncbi:hypothetical protein PHMEG_00032743, partial [Phytophthora megakarya]